MLVSVYIHELGHWIVGRLAGFEIIEGCFCVGKRHLKKGKYTLGINPFKVSYIYFDFANILYTTNIKSIIIRSSISLGGPLINLIASIISFIAIYNSHEFNLFTLLLVVFMMVNFLSFVFNLFPTGTNASVSDGRQFIRRVLGKSETEFYISKKEMFIESDFDNVMYLKAETTPSNDLLNDKIKGTFFTTDRKFNNGYFRPHKNGMWLVIQNKQCYPSLKSYPTFKHLLLNEEVPSEM